MLKDKCVSNVIIMKVKPKLK